MSLMSRIRPIATALALLLTVLVVPVTTAGPAPAAPAYTATYGTPPAVCSLTWVSRSSAADNDWRSVTYGNDLFVAVSASGTNRVMTSPDGITWTAQTTPTDAVTPPVYDWKSVTFAKDPSSSDSAVQSGLFVAVGSRVVSSVTKGGVMTSPDGVNWTLRTAAIDQGLTSVTYGNGLFVAVSNTILQGGSNRVMTSPDGVNWTAVAGINKVWNSVTFAKDPSNAAVSGGLFVAVASSASGNSVMTSPDGSTWTQQSSGLGVQDRSWNSVTYGNGSFVAVAFSGSAAEAMTSPDGVTWSLRTTPSQTWASITFGGGLFVAVALSGTGNRVMTSPNGIDWTSGTSAADNLWFGATYGAGRFVAVSRTGTGNRVMTADCTAPVGFTVTAGTSTGGTTTATDANSDGTWDLVATPSAGYAFSGWSCDNGQTPASASSATTTITPTADTTCTATYTAFTVTAGTSTGGTTTATDANSDGTWDLVATPSAGYAFSGWSCDNGQTPASASSATTTITPTADTTCTPTFSALTGPTVTVTPYPSAKSITYGYATPSFRFKATTGVPPVVFTGTWTTPPTCSVQPPTRFGADGSYGPILPVGTYPVVCTGGVGSAGETVTYVDGTLTVAAAYAVKVYPRSGTWTTGQTPPALGYTASGFKNSETFASSGMTAPTCAVYTGTKGTGTPVTISSATAAGTYYNYCSGAVSTANYVSPVQYGSDGLVKVLPVVTTAITKIRPSYGYARGGTKVYIYGAGFAPGTTVSIGGVACTRVSLNRYGTQITCYTGAHAIGLVDVVVTAPGGTATLTNGYRYK